MPLFAQTILARVFSPMHMHLGGFMGTMIGIPIKVVSLEGSPLTRRSQEERSWDKKRCLCHIHNLYFNFLFLQKERVYLQVFLPKGSKEKSKPMFFCHRWSIGKAIDFAASLTSLKNDNNKLTAKVTTGHNFFVKVLGYSFTSMFVYYSMIYFP